jgi:uncharacterized membrane protein
MRACSPFVACPALAVPCFAEQPLVCFGNEPSWNVDLTTPGIAKPEVMGEKTQTYRGTATHNDVLKETFWRGSRDGGRDLEVFLTDKSCSDQLAAGWPPLTMRLESGRVFGSSTPTPSRETRP